MRDEATSTQKWLSALSEDGVGFKVWDSTVDLELDRDHDQRLTADYGSELTITALPAAHRSGATFAELELAADQNLPLDGDVDAGIGVDGDNEQVDDANATEVKPKKTKPVIVLAGNYQVVSELGRGIMCTVYKVKDMTSGALMVLKLLPKEAWVEPAMLLRFNQEAERIEKIAHDNLIPFRAHGLTTEGQPYVLMDYLHGITLARAISASDGLPLPRVVQVFDQLCRGLSAAHSAGLTHKDIRPDNIMFLSRKGDYNLKIVDFGIAKLASEGIEPMKQLQTTGDISGNPPFMSPEECRAEKLDARSDIYSIGCVMYCAMTGQPPYAGSTSPETWKKQVSENMPLPSKIKRNICSAATAGWVTVGDLEYIVMRCLEKNPADRYQTVDEVLADLDKLRKQIPLQKSQNRAAKGLRTTEVSLPERQGKKYVAEMVGTLVYLVIAVGIFVAAIVYFFTMPKSAPPVVPTAESSSQAETPGNPALPNNGAPVPSELQIPRPAGKGQAPVAPPTTPPQLIEAEKP